MVSLNHKLIVSLVFSVKKETSTRKFRWLTLKLLAYDYNIISHDKQKQITSQTYNHSNFDRLKNMSGGRISILFLCKYLQES